MVKVEYDEKEKSYEDMVNLFFELHDSTQVNRQGTYVGIQYRSEIFYNTDEERQIAERKEREHQQELALIAERARIERELAEEEQRVIREESKRKRKEIKQRKRTERELKKYQRMGYEIIE